jgi:subtilisin family serine protease
MSGTFEEIAQVGADVAAFTDMGLINETQYCYQVTAFNGDGPSHPSNTSCATTPTPPPGACVDTGNHDGLSQLWNITRVGADQNEHWQATQRPGCEIQTWFFGLDTGVDSDHPDLNVVEVANFVASEPGRSGEDGHSHGTHTAGTAAAIDGNGGVVGVAPGAPVFGFRVCTDNGECDYDDILAAIDEVTARKVANPNQPMVGNLSLGGTVSEILDGALRESANAGVVFSVAAGNGILGACFFPADAQNSTPARVGDDDINENNGSDGDTRRVNGVITTTSSDQLDNDANCNYGNPVTIAAPGVAIYSTGLNGGYSTNSGTSMAAPHVAGAAALYLQMFPDATPFQVEQWLVNRLDPFASSRTPNALGRLNVIWP